MIKVVAPRTFRPEALTQALSLYQELISQSRPEKGCLSYDLYQLDGDPNTLVVLEEWEDKAALSVHSQSPHYTRIVPRLRELAAPDAPALPGVLILNKAPQA